MTIEEVRTSAPGSTTWDDEVTGLHLRVSDKGIRRWFLFYRTKTGVQRRPKLGEYPLVTLQDARERAKKLLAMVAVGQDPVAEWKAARREITVAQLFQRVWDDYWNKPRFKRTGHAEEVWRLYTRHVAQRFGRLKLSEVTPGTVREWHEKLALTPTGANRALEVLSRLFSFAEEREIRPQNTNPCRVVRAFPEKKRGRFATEEEIYRIGQILDRDVERFPRETAFIVLLILTGARPSAIARAHRSDLQRHGEVGLPILHGKTTDTTGEKEVIVVPAAAMRVIDLLPERDDGLLVGGPIPRRYWEKVREEAGCPDLWIRDWRRTFSSVGLSSGVELGLIGELLNHRDVQTTKRYAKAMPQARIRAAGVIANRMEGYLSASSRLALPPVSQPD